MHYLLNDFKYYIAVLLCCIVAFRCFLVFFSLLFCCLPLVVVLFVLWAYFVLKEFSR